ncbi:MAG: phosphoribosylpyrophosphate synthetase [Phaeodactylibacter sp.]|nr:phosphoribosylpyrophosphate synthetase [Phaeodactylibacter sp.]
MQSFDTLSEAISALQKKGFTYDFNLDKEQLFCKALNRGYAPSAFKVVQFFRFEGESNPDDSSILYAIETTDAIKGLLVDAYGAYSGEISEELTQALRIRP